MYPRLTPCARWAIALFFVLLLEPTRCGLQPVTGQAAEIPPALAITEGKTSQGYPYLFGGVSSNEREAMEQRAKDYNLRLVFAEKTGPYVAGVTIVLATGKGGEILSIATDGPWFYIQLPPGIYEVKATFQGQTKQIKSVNVVSKTLQQTLIWDLGEKPQ
jgi:hypothetical protein